MIEIKKMMKKNFCKLSSSDCVELAVKLIDRKSIEYLLIEKEGKIKGAVTPRGLIGYPPSRLIMDCEIEPIGIIAEETLLNEALKVLEEKKVNFLVILNKKKIPIGAVNREIIVSFLYQELKRLNEEKAMLLKEIHHRVKNNMQIISSLLRIQSRTAENKNIVDIFKESQNRIKSMALIHQKFYQSKNLLNINFKEYIKELAYSLVQVYGVSTNKIILKIDVDDIPLGINTAIPCGLLLNELISNSLKHAFPKGENGEINISLSRIDENKIELRVSDNGSGISADLDFKKTGSLGLQLVTTLVQNQLEGEIKLNRSRGTEFKIMFKDRC